MNSTIDLSFRYTESDYVRAMRAHYALHLRVRLDIAIAAAFGAVGIWFWRSPGLHAVGLFSIVVSAVFSLILIAAFLVIPPLVFRRDPSFREDYSLIFSPEGIHFRTAKIDTQLEWTKYSKELIASHSYLLYYSPRQFTVIPKRVFENAEQQQAFEG